MPEKPTYPCLIVRALDGSHVWLRVDLGLDVVVWRSLRLAGIAAPELAGPDAERADAARAFVERWSLRYDPTYCRLSRDPRARLTDWTAEIFAPRPEPEPPANLADDLVDRGLAYRIEEPTP